MVERGTEEYFGGGAGRIGERDGVLDSALIGFLDRQRCDRDPRAFQGVANPLQRNAVPHLPADVHHLIRLTGDDDDACKTFVHPQVERVTVGTAALRETQDIESEAAPAIDVAGLNLDVAQALDVVHQIIARSGSGGSMPIELERRRETPYSARG